jgi:hypothetical protein
MLALDDAALARLMIGATRIRASERGRGSSLRATVLQPAVAATKNPHEYGTSLPLNRPVRIKSRALW